MKLGKLQRKWVNALKEHPERQMIGSLGTKRGSTYKACCLGEGGLVAGVCEWIKPAYQTGKIKFLVTKTIVRHSANLAGGAYRELGLRGSCGEAMDPTMPDLAQMNDEGMSWPEIGVILETFPEEYFTESV